MGMHCVSSEAPNRIAATSMYTKNIQTVMLGEGVACVNTPGFNPNVSEAGGQVRHVARKLPLLLPLFKVIRNTYCCKIMENFLMSISVRFPPPRKAASAAYYYGNVHIFFVCERLQIRFTYKKNH